MAFYCKDLLHGNGYTRWFDKSMTCVIYDNGKVRGEEGERERREREKWEGKREEEKILRGKERWRERGGGREWLCYHVLS